MDSHSPKSSFGPYIACGLGAIILVACKLAAYRLLGDPFLTAIWAPPIVCGVFGYWAGAVRRPRIAIAGWVAAAIGSCVADIVASPSTWPRASPPGTEFEWLFLITFGISTVISPFFAIAAYFLSRHMYATGPLK